MEVRMETGMEMGMGWRPGTGMGTLSQRLQWPWEGDRTGGDVSPPKAPVPW